MLTENQKAIQEEAHYMNLKQYIADIEKLEKERYGMELTMNQITRKVESLGNKGRIMRDACSVPEGDTRLSNFGIFWIVPIIWAIPGLWITNSIGRIDSHILWIFLIPPAVVILLMIGFTIRQKIKYNAEQKEIEQKYAKDLQADQKRVERENQIALQYKNAYKVIHRAYCNTRSTLDKLYALGVVYKKYQHLVAIVMFSEYLQSGRCSTLEGHEGAYNIYENEIRLGIINDKLNEIINRLDRIERNQYRLYESIREVNQQQSRILSNLDMMAQRLDSQSSKLEYIAYDAHVAQMNSSLALAYHL